ncbi:MAG: YdbL family protein [Steroidobacteraceae bacterium]
MRKALPVKIMLASFLLAACVTINVYFPAAAAEKAADQIIDAVKSGAADTARSDAPPQGAIAAPRQNILLAMTGRLLYALVPAAEAQSETSLDVSSPEIRAITSSMQKRFADLKPYFASGVVGLTNNGLIEIRDAGSVPIAERAQVKRLIAEDNKDRDALYAEIAKANGHPEWQDDIRKIFASRWIARLAEPGWYYQDAGGNWTQK